MAKYTLFSTNGLDMINAYDNSTTVEIVYWVGAFDAELYNDYNNGVDVQIASYALASDLYPNDGLVNETVWADDVTKNYIYWGGTIGTNQETPMVSNLFKGVTYQHVVDNEDGSVTNNTKGNFKITMRSDVKIVVNKVGLYGITRTADGIQTGTPYLLAQVIIPEAQTISPYTNDSFAVDELVMDFQIDVSAFEDGFNNKVFASQEDYWSRVSYINGKYGLHSDGDVYIASTLGVEDISNNYNSDIAVAKLMVGTFSNINYSVDPELEKDLPQLALQFVPKTETSFAPRIRTTMRTTEYGDCEFDFNGACDNIHGYFAITPKSDKTFGFGNKSNRWRSGTFSKYFDLYSGEYDEVENARFVNGSGSLILSGTYVCLNNQNQLLVSKATSPNTIGKATRDIPVTDNDLSNNVEMFKDKYFEYIDKTYGYISLRENDTSISPYGLGYFGNSSIKVGPHHDSRDNSGVLKNNYFYMYGNVSNYIASTESLTGTKLNVEYPLAVRSTSDINLYTISIGAISDNEIIGVGASTWESHEQAIAGEISNMIEMGSNRNTNKFIKNVIGVGAKPTIYDSFYANNNFNQYSIDENLNTIDNIRESLFGSGNNTGDVYAGYTNPSDGSSALDEAFNGIFKDVNIASSRYIYTFGDIVPMVDGLNNLGGYNHNYRTLYVESISGGNLNKYDPVKNITYGGVEYPDNNKNIVIDGHLYQSNPIGGIKRIPGGNRWHEINCNVLGNSTDYIDSGYIKQLYIGNTNNNVVLSSSSMLVGGSFTIGSVSNKIDTLYVKNLICDSGEFVSLSAGDVDPFELDTDVYVSNGELYYDNDGKFTDCVIRSKITVAFDILNGIRMLQIKSVGGGDPFNENVSKQDTFFTKITLKAKDIDFKDWLWIKIVEKNSNADRSSYDIVYQNIENYYGETSPGNCFSWRFRLNAVSINLERKVRAYGCDGSTTTPFSVGGTLTLK